MEPASGVKRSSATRSEPSHPVGEIPLALSSEQRAIVDFLQAEGCGLTMRQLQARLSCPAEEVARAIGGLLELRLITRLNTLVPSYTCRAPAQEAHKEG